MSELAWLIVWTTSIGFVLGAAFGFLVTLWLVVWCFNRDPAWWHRLVDRAAAGQNERAR